MIFFEEVPEYKGTIYHVDMPLAMSHFIYRNTIVEDFHADAKPLTKEQEQLLYNYMYSMLLHYHELRNEVIEIYGKYISINNPEDIDKEDEEKVKMFFFALGFSTSCGSSWDKPEDISKIEDAKYYEKKLKIDGICHVDLYALLEGVIAYLWNGELKKAFDNEILLTDAAMKIINKDVYNKMKYLYDLAVNNENEKIADLLTVYYATSDLKAEKIKVRV